MRAPDRTITHHFANVVNLPECLQSKALGHDLSALGKGAIEALTAAGYVLIDPADDDQVVALGTALRDSGGWVPVNTFSNLAAALHEFANPTPKKPEEPTGLGAVVEDAEKVRWIRSNPRGEAKWQQENAGALGIKLSYRTWRMIRATRVLSEGVSA